MSGAMNFGGGGGGTPLATVPGTNILNPWTTQQLQADAQANGSIRQVAQKYRQIIGTFPVTPVYGVPTVITVPVTNVGLITRFIAELSVTITNPNAGSTISRTALAPFAALSNVQYTDPANFQRINTTGFHLASIMAMRHRRTPGAAYTTDSPSGFGSVIQPIAAPSTIANNASGTLRCFYEIPLAYSSRSFQGAVFAGAVFATQTLQFTISPTLAQNGTDPIAACYTGASNANPPTYSAVLTVWQEYFDGFPTAWLAGLSPSLSTIYELKSSLFAPIVSNYDNYFRYNNLRQFMSTIVMYDNGGVMNPGTDITYFQLQSANQTIEWKNDVYLQSLITRQAFGDDAPSGVYFFNQREDPIITAAEGNTLLSLNPSSAANGAYALVMWEDLAVNSVLASAPSLAGTGGLSA